MFIEFHAVARPDIQSGHMQSTKFEIFVDVNGKCERFAEIVSNEALVIDGYIDHFFNRFVSKFKSAAAKSLNKE